MAVFVFGAGWRISRFVLKKSGAGRLPLLRGETG